MNPLGMGPDGFQLVLGFNTSAGEQVATRSPGAFVFKTLNTPGAGNMGIAALSGDAMALSSTSYNKAGLPDTNDPGWSLIRVYLVRKVARELLPPKA
jgi:hypothetical protein